MAEPIWVKLSGIIEDGAENDLAKEFFKKLKYKKLVKLLGNTGCSAFTPMGWYRLSGIIEDGAQNDLTKEFL